MSDPGGAFFHDLIENVVIWEDSDDVPTDVVKVPAEAQDIEPPAAHHDLPVDSHEVDLAPSDHLVADGTVIDAHHVDEIGHEAAEHSAAVDHTHEADGMA